MQDILELAIRMKNHFGKDEGKFMAGGENEKHPLIELAERHQRKIAAFQGEGLITPQDWEMRHQLIVIPGENGGEPQLVQPVSWVDGRELTDDVNVRFPDGRLGIVDRSQTMVLVKRHLTDADRRLLQEYLETPETDQESLRKTQF